MAVTSRLFILRHHPSFPDPEIAPEKDALNCVRVLTRILPFLYEKDELKSWEEKFFWGARKKRTRKASIANEVLFDEAQQDKAKVATTEEEFEDAKPLAAELIDTLVDLLFFSGLTLPEQAPGRPKVTYAIWQSGVGCNTAVATTKEYESNRAEILRLLLTLAGQSLYMTPNVLPQQGVRALTYMCTCSDKQIVLSVLCSLLNTVGSPHFDDMSYHTYKNADSQVQSSNVACALQRTRLQRREASFGHVFFAATPFYPGVSNPGRLDGPEELLPPLLGTTSSTTRLPVHR